MKKIGILLILFLTLIWQTGCGMGETEAEDGCYVYYLSSLETKLIVQKVQLTSQETEKQITQMREYLSSTPAKLEYKAPFALVKPLSVRLNDGRLTFDMEAEYKKLPATTEVLIRAAIVRTFTQLDGVNYVIITVEGEQLYDSAGTPVGLMSADQFINNDGNEINTYEMTRVRLYFANESGDKLIAAYREKIYSTNTPMERFVVEELIKGPSGQISGLYPTINPETKILSISTKDGICYVNFDSAFLSGVGNVTYDAEVYSIVNSLAELSNVNKVQILVNGEVPATFTAGIFERNLDFVTVLTP